MLKRSTLDEIVRDHRLDEEAVALALELSGARPDAAAWRAFATRLFAAAGVAGLGAGAIFFVAANWRELAVLGRFGLVEGFFAASVAAALWRPPPHAVGRAALVLATLLAGALLALFGQAYQTGADVYELFAAWALLALPFALAGGSGALWATWRGIANVALALVFGWIGPGHLLWRVFDRWGADRPVLLLVPCAVNLLAAALFAALHGTRFARHAPRGLVRMLAGLGFLYGTAAGIAQALSTESSHLAIPAFALASAAIAVAALRAKRDVFPLVLVIGSWIAISTAFLVHAIRFEDLGTLLVIAAWLVGTSSAAAFALMRWVREWGVDEDELPEAAA
jgi:uncharacterized membrane protein